MLSACSRCKTSTIEGPLQRALRLAQRDQMESIYAVSGWRGHTDATFSESRPAGNVNRRVAPAEWRAHYTHGAIRRASGQCEGGREQGARNVGARALLRERAVFRGVADLVSWARSEA